MAAFNLPNLQSAFRSVLHHCFLPCNLLCFRFLYNLLFEAWFHTITFTQLILPSTSLLNTRMREQDANFNDRSHKLMMGLPYITIQMITVTQILQPCLSWFNKIAFTVSKKVLSLWKFSALNSIKSGLNPDYEGMEFQSFHKHNFLSKSYDRGIHFAWNTIPTHISSIIG